MTKWVEEGGWYGDVTLEGDYISLHRDDYISVNGGIVPLPKVNEIKDNVLQLVACRFNNQIYLAGQSNIGKGNYIYEDGKWRIISPSFGTFACCFGNGELYLVVGPNQYRIYDLGIRQLSPIINKQLGSQGIHYIDYSQSPDGIITSDATYGPSPYNLSQWILRVDVVLGQSYTDGCIADLLNLTQNYYKLESGDCQFLRFYRRGNNLAIAIVKQVEVTTVFYWMTVDELKLDFPPAFPLPPNPKPEPEMLQASNEYDTVVRVMAEHPEVNTNDENQRGKIVDYCCVDLNASGTKKPWGRKARNPDGSNKNTDSLTYLRTDGKFEIYDIINGTNGKASWDLGLTPTNSTGIYFQGENGYWAFAEPVSNTLPTPVPPIAHIDKEDVRNGCNGIIAFYNQPIGLNRAARGIPSPIDVHDQAAWDWVAMFLTEMANGKNMNEALTIVINQIKTFPEYKEQHP